MSYRVIVVDANTIRLSRDGATPIDLRTLSLRPSGIRLQEVSRRFVPADVSSGAGTLTSAGSKITTGTQFRVSSDQSVPGGLSPNTTYTAIVVGGNIQPSIDGVTPIPLTSPGSGDLKINLVATGELLTPPYKVVSSIEVMGGVMANLTPIDYQINDGVTTAIRAMGGVMMGAVLGPVTDIGVVMSAGAMAGAMARATEYDAISWADGVPNWPNITTAQWENMR